MISQLLRRRTYYEKWRLCLKVRWLGNACLEVFGEKHFLIDPNFLVNVKKFLEFILITHEHADHYSPEKCAKILPKTTVYAPRTTLDKFGIEGVAVKTGDKIDGIEVLESDCWGSEESVSYFYKGLLHSGDSAKFPEIDGVKLVFTACFLDYYEDYMRAFKRLRPDLVIPFHYDVQKSPDNAVGLKQMCKERGINCRLLKVGEYIEI